MKTVPTQLLTALLAIGATWLTLRILSPPPPPAAATTQRQPLINQCAMHPQVRSEQPGRCTICGMELTPAAENRQAGDQFVMEHVVTLSRSQIQVLDVQTVAAKIRPLVRTLPVAGIIAENTLRHRVISAYQDGRIDKLLVSGLGTEVTAGQALAEFLSPGLLQAEREYRQVGAAQRKNATLQLRQNAIAPELIETPYITASVQRLRTMGLTPAQIVALDEKPADVLTSQILCPINGTVVSQAIYEGQYVATGSQLFEIADFSTMWFIFRVYEQDLPWLKTGQSVRVAAPTIPEKSYSGKITFINPSFEDATRSTSVRVELPNPLVNGSRELLNRSYAEGKVELDAPPVLTIPRSAVLETGSQAVTYIDQGEGAYERRILQTGRRGDTDLEILSGLKENERVVTNGNLLIDGQAEMNRAFTPPPEPTAAATPPTGLNDAQKVAVAEFIRVADAMAAALAADDLTAFNAASDPAMSLTAAMVRQLRPQVADSMALDTLDATPQFHHCDNLKSARVAFHKFTVAATAALQPLRKAVNAPAFQIYECGMVSQAIPGVPKKARWIQTNGRELQNPFFGSEMADCGEEIQP